jgi:hypothetical protein
MEQVDTKKKILIVDDPRTTFEFLSIRLIDITSQTNGLTLTNSCGLITPT